MERRRQGAPVAADLVWLLPCCLCCQSFCLLMRHSYHCMLVCNAQSEYGRTLGWEMGCSSEQSQRHPDWHTALLLCRLYDCDFNQQLELGLPVVCGGNGNGAAGSGSAPLTVFDVESLNELIGRRIAADSHCFGCTAGVGSSCQGATSSSDDQS
jgi:hypothetical protein